MTDDLSKTVICFGEILWDSLPRGMFPGGAPINVAYHLKHLGMHPIPVTAVGCDQLGEELLQRLQSWGIDTSTVTRHPSRPTGLARVTMVGGSPAFEIVENVAWDCIDVPPAVLKLAPHCGAVVYGTLAQRSEHNYDQLGALLSLCPNALKVFDVNLRAPYDSADRVWALARHATLIKLNDQELGRLMNELLPLAELGDAVRRFARRSGVERVCLTAGAAGAGLLMDGTWHWEPARPVLVRDSVGAGDAFLAALLFGLLQRADAPAEVLRKACRLAEFVVTQDGAAPAYRVNDQGIALAAS
ncbi:MAG: PfkB family carbohydrate kinase [Verrucomicrobiota bacterium]